MSAKIKVSYEYHSELLDIISRLGKAVDSVKQSPQPTKEGNRMAYIKLKSLPCFAKDGIMQGKEVPWDVSGMDT